MGNWKDELEIMCHLTHFFPSALHASIWTWDPFESNWQYSDSPAEACPQPRRTGQVPSRGRVGWPPEMKTIIKLNNCSNMFSRDLLQTLPVLALIKRNDWRKGKCFDVGWASVVEEFDSDASRLFFEDKKRKPPSVKRVSELLQFHYSRTDDILISSSIY